MMPWPLSFVLRRLGAGALLLALIVVTLAVPARHVLLPAWPERVDEVLTDDGPERIERRFLPAGTRQPADVLVVARNQPVTLWRLETASDEVSHAWLAGLRDAEGRLLPGLPAWLEVVRLDGPLPEPVQLVVIDAARETREIEGNRIVRMFRPNAMSLAQRTALWRDRLDERWQWPFRATADARMTPLPR